MVVLAMVVLGGLAAASAVAADLQPDHAAVPAVAGHEDAAEEHHGESMGAFLSRIANFVILAAGLYYLLRSPLGRYLDARAQQIRSDLEHASDTRALAATRLAEIEARLSALPGELDVLRQRGSAQIEAEQRRIMEVASAERDRLIEQARREIGRQLQIARRDLTAHAADLAVGVARSRLARELTDDQQVRLVDRYVTQVGQLS